MASTVPLKVGDVLVPIKGTTWEALNWRQLEVMSQTRHKDVTQYWVKMMQENGTETLHTLNLGTLRDGWTRKEKFFKVGSRYRFDTSKWVVSDEYRIMEVYTVSDPLTPDDDAVAFAVAKDAMTGKQYGTSLTRSDFDKMSKV
jgi:hypothetical protein